MAARNRWSMPEEKEENAFVSAWKRPLVLFGVPFGIPTEISVPPGVRYYRRLTFAGLAWRTRDRCIEQRQNRPRLNGALSVVVTFDAPRRVAAAGPETRGEK